MNRIINISRVTCEVRSRFERSDRCTPPKNAQYQCQSTRFKVVFVLVAFAVWHYRWCRKENKYVSASIPTNNNTNNNNKKMNNDNMVFLWNWDLNSSPQNKLWFWSDGSKFDYQSWGQGEPNNYGGNEHCLQMNAGGTVSPLSFTDPFIKCNF